MSRGSTQHPAGLWGKVLRQGQLKMYQNILIQLGQDQQTLEEALDWVGQAQVGTGSWRDSTKPGSDPVNDSPLEICDFSGTGNVIFYP